MMVIKKNHSIKDILKTKKIIRLEGEQALSQALSKLRSSHDAAFVFDKDKFLGFISPYYIFNSRSAKNESKLKTLAKKSEKLFLDSSLGKVAQVMLNTKVHYLPVFDNKNKFAGIATIRRLLKYVLKNKLMQKSDHLTLTNRKLITASNKSNLGDILKIIKKNKIAKLPIVNENNKLVGIISQFDIKDLVHQKFNSGKMDRKGDKNSNLSQKIDSYMKKMLVTVNHMPKFSEATKMMLDKKVGSLIVIDKNNQPISIVTKKDLLQTIATHLK